MTAPGYHVLGIGNALVDVIAHAEEDFLLAHGMRKGGMALIDEPRAEALYQQMGPGTEISGGSAANTLVGVASLGAPAAFIGKVKADGLGRAFTHDIRAAGVDFATPAASEGPATGRSLILVTPDGERTMNTYLGAAQNLRPDDVPAGLVADSAITYLEGYLWDPADAKAAFLKAAALAHEAGRLVALSLSFANEAEVKSLYQTADFDSALAGLREDAALGVVTRSEKGCLIITREETHAVPAAPIERFVDATGAGDLFAAGFLFGLARGLDLPTAGGIGALCAAEIIQHLGARPESSLRTLVGQNGYAL
jgi:sugar/nucleoside kinase (ribokinase family)